MFINSKIIQIHPTLKCNLSCMHCYSCSGPFKSNELDPADICSFISEMRDFGYEEVAISGGEPMLFGGLQEISEFCKKLSMRLSVISNGMFEERIIEFVTSFNPSAVSISIDGTLALHDRIRCKSGAFLTSMQTIENLVGVCKAGNSDTKIGVSLAVTKDVIVDLPKLVNEIAELDVNHINLHPVSVVGRALSSKMPELNEVDLMRLYLIQQALNLEIKDTLVSTDVYLPSVHHLTDRNDKLINPLVVRENGDVLPFTFWCPAKFKMGSITDRHIKPFITPHLASAMDAAIVQLNKLRAGNIYGQLESELNSIARS